MRAGTDTALTRYRDDGRLEIDNNPAERALRAVALGRKNSGCSPDRMTAVSAPPPSTRSWAPRSSITLIRKTTCDTSWSASQSI